MFHVVSAVTGRIDQWADEAENYSFDRAVRVMIDDGVKREILIISAYPGWAEVVFGLAVVF